MTKTAAPAPADVVEPKPADTTPSDAAPDVPAFSWDTMAAPLAMPSTVAKPAASANVVETTPDKIREAVERLLAVNVARVHAAAKSTAKRPRIDFEWYLQELPDEETAGKFEKMVGKYCRNRPSTGVIPHRDLASPMGPVTARFGKAGYYRIIPGQDITPCASTDSGAKLCIRYSVRQFQARGESSK